MDLVIVVAYPVLVIVFYLEVNVLDVLAVVKHVMQIKTVCNVYLLFIYIKIRVFQIALMECLEVITHVIYVIHNAKHAQMKVITVVLAVTCQIF
jgi:hypothetical protein